MGPAKHCIGSMSFGLTRNIDRSPCDRSPLFRRPFIDYWVWFGGYWGLLERIASVAVWEVCCGGAPIYPISSGSLGSSACIWGLF